MLPAAAVEQDGHRVGSRAGGQAQVAELARMGAVGQVHAGGIVAASG